MSAEKRSSKSGEKKPSKTAVIKSLKGLKPIPGPRKRLLLYGQWCKTWYWPIAKGTSEAQLNEYKKIIRSYVKRHLKGHKNKNGIPFRPHFQFEPTHMEPAASKLSLMVILDPPPEFPPEGGGLINPPPPSQPPPPYT